MKRTAGLVAISLVCAVNTAVAAERSFGVGTAVGFGAGATAIKTGSLEATGVGALLMLPSLELRFFLNDTLSLDISSPVLNTVVIGAAGYGFGWRSDLHLTFNFGSGTARAMLGPGLGATIVTTGGDVGVGLVIPGILGVELLTDGRGFGFQVGARPFLAFNLSGIGSYSVLAGGVIGVLGFVWYGT
jgi:hypothetical protein